MTDLIRKIIYKSAAFVIRITPFFILDSISVLFGSLAWNIWKRRRNIALENLSQAFPGKTGKEISSIGKKSFINSAKTFFELFKQPVFKKKWEDYCVTDGLENLEKACSEGKGVIISVAHFGNWEFLVMVCALMGFSVSGIQKTQKDIVFDEVLNEYRKDSGIKLVGRKSGLIGAVRYLKKGYLLFIATDQKAHTGGIKTEFFGRECLTTPLPFLLSEKFDTPMVTAYCRRGGDKRFELRFMEPVYLKGKEKQEAVQFFTDINQEYIRKYPEQWFWAHRRWQI